MFGFFRWRFEACLAASGLSRKSAGSSRRRTLSVEILEDRLAPAVIVVTSPLDNTTAGDGFVTLREAINAANAQSAAGLGDVTANTIGANTIIFGGAATNTNIILTGVGDTSVGPSAFKITSNITIDGTGLGSHGIFRNLAATSFRLFLVNNANGNLQVHDTILGGGNPGNTNDGGAVLLNNGNVSLANVTIDGNAARNGGGIQESGGTLTLSLACTFNNNQTSGSNPSGTGGGLDLIGGTLNGFANFTNNTALIGGGFYTSGTNGSFGLSGFTFTGNHAAFGGFAYIDNSTYTFSSTVVSGNIASAGAGFYFNNSTSILNGCTVSGNSATSGGGGIFYALGTATLNGVTVSDNSASLGGGGIYDNDCALTVQQQSVIKGNRSNAGGGINVAGDAGVSTSLIVDASTIGGPNANDGNTASLDGGGINVNGASGANVSVTLRNGALVTNNQANGDGGGIALSLGNLTVSGAILQGNQADADKNNSGSGGAIAVDGSGAARLTLTNTVAGGLVTANGNLAANGGALAVTNANATVSVFASTLATNPATGAGGGLYVTSGTTYVTNSTISTKTGGGGVYVAGGTVRFTNATVTLNQTVGVNRTGGTVQAGNTIFAGNANGEFAGTVTSLGNNLFGSASGLLGNVASDLTGAVANLGPLAYNDNAPTPTHALLGGSDAINAGN